MASNLVFRYSQAYDEMLSLMMGKPVNEVDAVAAKDFVKKLEALWNREGRKITKEIERVSGLRFQQRMECYVVRRMLFESISHPLTLRMHRHVEVLRGILVHELLHNLLVQHGARASKVLNQLAGNHDFRVHFPVLLCERRVLEKLYGRWKQEKRVEDLDDVWRAVNKVYPVFLREQRGVLRFLQDVARGKV